MSQEKTSVRLATKNDLDAITRVQVRAFVHDAVYNWVHGLERFLDPIPDGDEIPLVEKNARKRAAFCRALTTSCLIKGRVYVVVYDDKIAAVSLWLPPKSRVHVYDAPTMIRSGFLQHILRVGWKAVDVRSGHVSCSASVYPRYLSQQRMALTYQVQAEEATNAEFKARGFSKGATNSWYLCNLCTDPAHQGKGMYVFTLLRITTNTTTIRLCQFIAQAHLGRGCR